MLGKTNITALAEGGIVTEVEDYKWVQMQSGTYGNFIKAIYKGGYLVAITMDGTVVYTEDGEVWNTHILDYPDCKLNDIEWDGLQFVVVGSYKEGTMQTPLCLTSDHLDEFVERNFKVNTSLTYLEYCCAFQGNGKMVLVARYSTGTDIVTTDFTTEGTDYARYISTMTTGTVTVKTKTAKSTSRGILLICTNISDSSRIATVKDGLFSTAATLEYSIGADKVSVFECKDDLYFLYLVAAKNYTLNKVTSSNEVLTMCTGQNFMFVDGVYFNECQLFINNHEMLVVRKGESIADKTVDDLIEIAPEFTMNCIAKAFGQLYIFGNQGLILRSSVETGNEEGIAVQAMSAKKALTDAKAYADNLYAELVARIEALEA